jgi:hypothetical protein
MKSKVDDWKSDSECEGDIVCLSDLPGHGAVAASAAVLSEPHDAPLPVEHGVSKSAALKPMDVLADSGPDMSQPPKLPSGASLTVAVPEKKEDGEYKYKVPEKPPFASDIAKAVSTAPPPDFSKQAKPRGRKPTNAVSKAIDDEVGEPAGDDEDDENDEHAHDEKPRKRQKTAPNRPNVRRPRAKATPKAKAKAAAKSGAKKPQAKAASKASKTKANAAAKTKPTRGRKGSTASKDTVSADDEPKPKKPRTSRAIRMSATDNAEAPAKSNSAGTVPKDAVPAPSHIHANNVYSNAYRKAMAETKDKAVAREIARKATAFFRQHAMLRPVWTGNFYKKVK